MKVIWSIYQQAHSVLVFLGHGPDYPAMYGFFETVKTDSHTETSIDPAVVTRTRSIRSELKPLLGTPYNGQNFHNPSLRQTVLSNYYKVSSS